MSWHTGSFAGTAAGSLITVLDAILTLNSHWTVYDAAAGTNAKVYECRDDDENVLFYLKVDDNYTGYAILEMWEGWDAGAHTGVGVGILVTTSTYTFRLYRATGGWMISLLDHRFVYINSSYSANYIGCPRRYDASLNTPCLITETTGSSKYNPLGQIYTGGTNVVCRWLFDEAGNQTMVQGGGGAQYMAADLMKGSDGKFRFPEGVIANATSLIALGTLEGVWNGPGSTAVGLVSGDIVTIDGEDWIACGGSYSTKYYCMVKKA